MSRVVLTLLDGLRPDALSPERTPNLLRAAANGAHTLAARSVMPSITLPCHFSIFHSVPPQRHGILSNSYAPMARPVIGLFDAANDAGKVCGSLYNWEELRDLSKPGSLHYSFHSRSSYDIEAGDRIIADQAVPLIAQGAFDLLFVYLGTIDTAGHLYGWMSDGYLDQVRQVDGEVGRLLDALPADTAMILHADHGGHDRNHGTESPEDMTIPWIITGGGVRAGHRIQRPVSLIDTAPTIARILSFSPPRDWEGAPVEEALL
ncbi:MAG: alkaline phosphatase family protein [Anaerolineae bacterium]|nr:alkaline phosphatase family protein [Anaerolineae bacterium]NUQ06348.1 alkaline phosphatase family protein [Anaerolineae bacterium]